MILAGGAFNTPQLLMLSGIGPRADLEKHGIAVRVDLAGVGQNLQDRYEVAVVNRMNFPAWESLAGATFTSADAQYHDWAGKRKGVYATNGGILSVVARSSAAAPQPDLFLYAVIGRFEGYFPGYSSMLATHPNYLTWVVLKAHTNNTAGQVTLRSADPRVPPDINFRYFDEGNDARGDDLKAVAAGVAIARRLTSGLKAKGLIAAEELPGDAVNDAGLPDFIKQQAWGHHASCTCRIGLRENGGVLSGDFKVHGVEGLRVVDASVFPRIPGFFIASAVYMIGEKAADVIVAPPRLRAAVRPAPGGGETPRPPRGRKREARKNPPPKEPPCSPPPPPPPPPSGCPWVFPPAFPPPPPPPRWPRLGGCAGGGGRRGGRRGKTKPPTKRFAYREPTASPSAAGRLGIVSGRGRGDHAMKRLLL